MADQRSPIAAPFALLIGLAAGLGSAAASAEADGPDFYTVRDVAPNDVLNIRAEADPHAPKVSKIPPDGTCIRDLGCKGGLTFQEFTEL